MSNFMAPQRPCTEEEVIALERLFSSRCGSAKLMSADGGIIDIPEPLYHLLKDIVEALSKGQSVSVIPHNREMTTQEAADCLNVSRPYFIKLLEKGEIPHVKVGKSRRVTFTDLMQYKERRDSSRRQSLDEMSAFLQERGFYDE